MTSAKEKARAIVDAVQQLEAGEGRRLIAIAGPPAAGKSTIAELVVASLLEAGAKAALVPMDGFHRENDDLRTAGLLARKGAPETFDLAGFSDLVRRLRDEPEVTVPLFDRARDCTVPEGFRIGPTDKTLVIEGNYLLFDEPGWRDLTTHWDFAVFIEEDLPELSRRLLQRWTDNGFSLDAAQEKAEANDLPNARRILERRLPSDLTMRAGSVAA